jgi:hypothetical protein
MAVSPSIHWGYLTACDFPRKSRRGGLKIIDFRAVIKHFSRWRKLPELATLVTFVSNLRGQTGKSTSNGATVLQFKVSRAGKMTSNRLPRGGLRGISSESITFLT